MGIPQVMPALAAAGRRVIVLDLPGMGGSDKPATGYDKKTMAGVVHGFVRALGYDQVDIAGHDVGAQVAFSFAVNHPEATRRVALLDVLHPDASMYQIRAACPGPALLPMVVRLQPGCRPARTATGRRAHFLISWVFDNFLLDPGAVTPADRAVYTRAYDTADGIRGANGWYQTFGQDIADLATYGQVSAPMLGLVSNLADGMFAKQMEATLPTQGATCGSCWCRTRATTSSRRRRRRHRRVQRLLRLISDPTSPLRRSHVNSRHPEPGTAGAAGVRDRARAAGQHRVVGGEPPTAL